MILSVKNVKEVDNLGTYFYIVYDYAYFFNTCDNIIYIFDY